MFTPKIQKAIETAAYLHRNQVRKGDPPLPYITHLVGTMLIVMPYTDDEDVMCAALLHDVLEDIAESDFNSQDMIREFSQKVYEIVSGVTEDTSIKGWRKMKEAYIEHLKSASNETLMISVADKIHNVSNLISLHNKIGNSMWKNFDFTAVDNIWYHESVLKVAQDKLPNGLWDQYRKVIQEAKTAYTEDI